MNMRSPTVQDSDLSARTKIREAALSLFGTEGFAVSVRAMTKAMPLPCRLRRSNHSPVC